MSDSHDPIEPDFFERMNELAHFLDTLFNGPEGSEREVGFVLLSFKFGDDPEERTNYISNAQLPNVIAMLRGFIKHAERRLADGTARNLQ